MIRAITVMGPSGCGKSTLAAALAEALDWRFIEGDDLHPPENRAKLARGEPLDDADRRPFIDAVGRELAAHPDGAVASCSALKRVYRDRLREFRDDMLFVLPELDRAELARRMAERPDHLMPPALVDSQLAALEMPAPTESILCIDGGQPLLRQVLAVRDYLAVRARDRTFRPPS